MNVFSDGSIIANTQSAVVDGSQFALVAFKANMNAERRKDGVTAAVHVARTTNCTGATT